jgi:hypothetical protein
MACCPRRDVELLNDRLLRCPAHSNYLFFRSTTLIHNNNDDFPQQVHAKAAVAGPLDWFLLSTNRLLLHMIIGGRNDSPTIEVKREKPKWLRLL